MSKKYSPTKWVANKTVATADMMNNIEGGINDLYDDICESSTSGDLLNENVNSFKVGTGSINGENKDFTNQMEQSVITLDNILGKTVKENTQLRNIELNIDDVNYCTLRSLPNGVCDEIKNNSLIKNVSVYKIPNDANWVHDGNVQTSGGSSTSIWYLKLPNITKIDDNVVSCYSQCGDSKLSENTSWATLKHRYEPGVALTSGGVVVIRISTNVTTKSEVNNYLSSVGGLTIYYPTIKTVTPINISVVAKPNDVINIDTPLPITCTHKVSLNTKSQIEELQEVVQKENKSVWQKLKELTDVKIKIEQNGYIKLPKLLGGLILQWGGIGTAFDNGIVRYSVVFPISYPNTVTGVFVNCYKVGGGNTFDVIVNSSDIGKTGFAVDAKHIYGGNWSTEFKWFSVGY